MNKKLITLVALFILSVPMVVMGMNNNEKKDNQQLKENAQKLLEKMRKKQLKKTPILSTENNSKNDNTVASCPICRNPMLDEHAITHIAVDSNNKKEIAHQVHAKCIVEYIRSLNPKAFLFDLSGPKLPLDEEYDYDYDLMSNPDEPVALPCALCTENEKTKMYLVKKSTIHKKYFAQLNALTLKERFFMLDTLPIKYARLTLEQYAKLSKEERNLICDAHTSRIILQKFAIKTTYAEYPDFGICNEDKINYVNDRLIHHRKIAIDQVFELLKKQPITLEFALLIHKNFNENGQKEFKKHIFLWALEADELLAPSANMTVDLSKPELLDEYAVTSTKNDKRAWSERKKKLRIALAKTYFPEFSEYDCKNYYEQIYEKATNYEAQTVVKNELSQFLGEK